MAEPYTLYGSYASYYTAKVRMYLRKKGIPFVERLPSDPMFRNRVRPSSGSHRIPQLLTPLGDVIQDSVAIVDELEPLFPELPAFPNTPRQRGFVHLMELLGSEGLVRLAWMHRWLFEENRRFVINDFGRSFRPQGTDEELNYYGNLIADRMMSYGLPESNAQVREALDDAYKQLLSLFEAHLIEHPYFLGGHPSAADYAVMGAMHAHLGRDPAGLRTMQDYAPRTFRWMEHMLVPEVKSPEFFHREIEYPPGDEVAQTALDILEWIADRYGEQFVLGALAFNQSVATRNAQSGELIDEVHDQPTLPPQTVEYQGDSHTHKTSLYGVWLTQRTQQYFSSLHKDQQNTVIDMFSSQCLKDLVTIPLTTPLARVNNRFAFA